MAVAEIPKHRLHNEIVYSREEVISHAGRLALKVAEDYDRVVSDLLVVPLLQGAEQFNGLLEAEMSALGFWPEFYPVKVNTYDHNNRPIDPRLAAPLPKDIFRPGRPYLFVDDMLHTGKTLAFMNQTLVDKKLAKKSSMIGKVPSLANMVMVERIDQQEYDVSANYAAFRTTLEDWLVGGGLDDQRLEGLSADCGRSLPYVAKALSDEQIELLRNEYDLPTRA
ncbi:MAG TPA: hypothetical protein VG964_00995 [Candidatus Saccharimonadales bacterium]|nr:hypothetical protein [Candidatus Saccharimonadales bacterium]